MTRYLSPEEVGEYGIISTTIGLAIYIIGLDFYTFNTREMLSNIKKDTVFYIRDQFVFHLISYLLFLPLISIMFIVNLLPIKYIIIFYFLLIMEHISQEFNRILITLSKPIIANFTLFFRSGAWAYVVIAILLFEDLGNLWMVLGAWTIGVFISIVLSLYYLRNLNWKKLSEKPIDWRWNIRGMKISLPLFFGNIGVKFSEYLDRYFISFFCGSALLGAYTFYGSLANLLVVFAQTGIVSVLSPKLIKSFQEKDFVSYGIVLKKIIAGLVISTVLIGVFLIFGIEIVIDIIGKSVYEENLTAFIILLIGYSFSVFSLIPHYALYVRHKDKQIIKSSLLSVAIAIIFNSILVPKYGLIGGAFSTCTSFLSLFLLKLFFANKYKL